MFVRVVCFVCARVQSPARHVKVQGSRLELPSERFELPGMRVLSFSGRRFRAYGLGTDPTHLQSFKGVY